MTDTILVILLAPLLFLQGKWVRYKTVKLPEPSGLRRGTEGTGKPLSLIVVGDSAAAGVGAQTQADALLGQVLDRLKSTYRVTYLLVAATGDRTVNSLARLQALPGESFDIAITSLGVNDVTGGVSLEKFTDLQRELVKVLRTKFDVRQIILSGLPPMGRFPALPNPLRWLLGRRSTKFDANIKSLAERVRAKYLKLDFTDDVQSMASDGFHPGPRVYAMWADQVASVLDAEAKARGRLMQPLDCK